MARFRRRELEVEAVQWTGDNLDEIKAMLSPDAMVEVLHHGQEASVFDGDQHVSLWVGDWLVPEAGTLRNEPDHSFPPPDFVLVSGVPESKPNQNRQVAREGVVAHGTE